MAKKRRMFEIEMPEDTAQPARAPETKTFPAGKVSDPKRRSPMASAISETLTSVQERKEIEGQIRAENDALAHEHVRLKSLGLVIELLPVGKIVTDKLIRDRAKGADPELDELMASIQEIGLSNPIRVEARKDGGFELIQGFRRLSAYRALGAEYGEIPAVVMPEGQGLEDLYRRMVDENLVRRDISFAEMAQLALDYARDPQTAVEDPKKAVSTLFKSASYQKRSYIRGFLPLVEHLGPHLTAPQTVPRKLGLQLAAKIEANGAGGVVALLESLADADVDAELAVLRGWAEGAGEETPAPETFPAGKVLPEVPASDDAAAEGKAKTSFQFRRREGQAKCTAVNGRLELRLDKDFSTINHRQLEAALQLMLDQLS